MSSIYWFKIVKKCLRRDRQQSFFFKQTRPPISKSPILHQQMAIQAALVICGLFICDFAYMRFKFWHFRRTYPLIIQCYWSRYMRIYYMRTNFLGPYLSHIKRANSTSLALGVKARATFSKTWNFINNFLTKFLLSK